MASSVIVTRQPLVRQVLVQLRDHQIHDLAEIRVRQRVEDDDLVQPVDEFRIEQPLHFLHHGVFHLLRRALLARPLEAQARVLLRKRAPRFDVMMMIVFLKSTVLPRPSVNWPSSNTCNRML